MFSTSTKWEVIMARNRPDKFNSRRLQIMNHRCHRCDACDVKACLLAISNIKSTQAHLNTRCNSFCMCAHQPPASSCDCGNKPRLDETVNNNTPKICSSFDFKWLKMEGQSLSGSKDHCPGKRLSMERLVDGTLGAWFWHVYGLQLHCTVAADILMAAVRLRIDHTHHQSSLYTADRQERLEQLLTCAWLVLPVFWASETINQGWLCSKDKVRTYDGLWAHLKKVRPHLSCFSSECRRWEGWWHKPEEQGWQK